MGGYIGPHLNSSQKMSELTHEEQLRLQLPPHGRWWAGTDSQKAMFEIYHAQGGLAVGWDTEHGGKMFGVYPTLNRETFMQLLLDVPWMHRHCYELLVENEPCKGYLDVEWVREQEPEHNTLKRLVAALRNKIHEVHSIEVELYVACSTRVTADDPALFKHSYHIVCNNLIFERNNDGNMKAFFTSIAGFTWMDGVEEKNMIDSKVYTKNRHFRLPHCCKRGSKFPLTRISGDPLLDEFSHEWGRDVKAVLPFFISQPARTENDAYISTPPALLQLVPRQSSAKRAKMTEGTGVSPSNKLFPVPLPVIQQMLVKAGDNVSKLGAVQYLPQEDQWKIQCDHKGQGRKCLLTQGTTHTSNNALLFINRMDARFRVNYQCMSSECAGGVKPILGYISIHQQTLEWQIALPVPPSQDAMHDDENDASIVPEHIQDDMTMQEDIPDAAEPDQDMQDNDAQSVDAPEIVAPPHDPDNPALNTYDMVKARFEENCFKVKIPFCYARIEQGHDPCLHSHIDLQHYYCDWKYWGLNKDEEMVKLPFITAWLRDENKRVVERIVVDPSNTMQDVYNMWKGFDVEKLQSVSDDLITGLIHPIKKHINDVITGGVEEHSMFFHHYLANILQRPWTKSQVAIFLFGAQGCGKGIIFEFFRHKILGNHCSYQTSKPEHDLFGRFANGAVNRVLIQVDEVKSLHEHTDQLKDFITNPTLNYEKKGKDTIVVANLANLILTSNNANALSISPDDRRFALFQCSSVHKGNTEYFQELGAHLGRADVARAYYQYLMSLDLSAYPISFQHIRPVTEFYKESQHNSIPIISRFFSALVNMEYKEKEVPARDLYRRYEHFQTTGNYKFLMTETAFGREAKKITGITKKKTRTVAIYQMEHEKIKKHLDDCNEYDMDAEI